LSTTCSTERVEEPMKFSISISPVEGPLAVEVVGLRKVPGDVLGEVRDPRARGPR
jgi:hypothetical protein